MALLADASALAPRVIAARDTGGVPDPVLRPAVSVEPLSGLGALDAVEDQWHDLAEHAAEPNPFFESFLLRPALRVLPGGRDAEILAVFDGATMIGLVPVRVRRTYRGLPLRTAQTWVHLHCFLATPLLRAGCERRALEAVVTHLRGRGVRVLRMRHMAADGPVAAAIDALCADEHLATAETRRFARAILASDLDGESYLAASINKKRRKEFGRLARRLSDHGVLSFEAADQSDPAAVEGAALTFLGLEAAGWKGRAGTAMACRRAEQRFFLEACHGAAARGRFHPLTLRAGADAVASIVNFDGAGAHGAGRFSFKIAFDEAHARLSPGVQLELELTRRVSGAAGLAFTDSCANPDHPMIDTIWRERRCMRDLNMALSPQVPARLIRLTAQLETTLARLRAHARAGLAALRGALCRSPTR